MIKVQLLLRPEVRSADRLADVQRIVRELGMKITTSGAASIVAELPEDAFQRLFGDLKQQSAPSGSSAPADFGRSSDRLPLDLQVPAALQQFVQSATTPPGHIYLSPKKPGG
jgi:hypothetical protein